MEAFTAAVIGVTCLVVLVLAWLIYREVQYVAKQFQGKHLRRNPQKKVKVS